MAILTIGFNPAIDRILECPDLHLGGHQPVRQIARLAAGKAANVSRALAQLSTDSIASGFIGAAEREFFHEQLLSVGPGRILCRFVDVLGKTRENITILDPQRRLETHLRDRGFAVTAEEATLLDKKLAHELKPGDMAIFSGSLCEGLPENYMDLLIDPCAQRQVKVVVDSSGAPLRAAATKPLWLLKPNLEELRELLGVPVADAPGAIRDAAAPLLKNIQHVLVTRGPAGAVLITRDGALLAKAPPAQPPVRTVGCGDYLLAGFISETAAGREPERALQVATAVAVARALSPRMEEFDPALMRATLETVVIEKI